MSKSRFKNWDVVCPYCDSANNYHILPTPANFVRMAINGATWLVAAAIDTFLVIGFAVEIHDAICLPLARRCVNCQGKFLAKAPLGREPICGNCDYDLTGNVSGTCPECGWKLTRRMRRRVRLKMKLEKRKAKREAKRRQVANTHSE